MLTNKFKNSFKSIKIPQFKIDLKIARDVSLIY